MARSDGPFEVIEKVGSNDYKLQLSGHMAISATFNIGDLSPYVDDPIEDPSDLRSNPSEEREVDAGAYPQGYPEDNQGQGDQDQGALSGKIRALFSFPSSRVYTVLGNQFADDPKVMIR